MATLPAYARSSSSIAKRIRLNSTFPVASSSLICRNARAPSTRNISSSQRFCADTIAGNSSMETSELSRSGRTTQDINEPRLPRSVQATYLRPLRRKAEYGVPACDLQLRSYNTRNLELMTDFALRAAYYLGLPASGPVPLPRMIERWTVSRSVFVHKKSQENFERITMRRLIQIQDAHPDVVQKWLGFVRKHAYYGVGMKANVWEHEKLGVGKEMDVKLENLKQITDPKWAHFGRRKNPQTAEQVMELMKSHELRRIDDGPMQERT